MTDLAQTPTRLVRQPPEFKGSEDEFSVWYSQFANFAKTMKIADPEYFGALVTYLDTMAFSIVENLNLSNEIKADPIQFKPFLEKALKSESEKIPASLALRYRSQKDEETLSQFAFQLEKLANKSNLDLGQTARQQILIDSFCTSVKNANLSIKLLEQTFATLADAVDSAIKIETAQNIRNFVQTGNNNASNDVEILASSSSSHTEMVSNPTNPSVPHNSQPANSSSREIGTQNFVSDNFRNYNSPGPRPQNPAQNQNSYNTNSNYTRNDYRHNNAQNLDQGWAPAPIHTSNYRYQGPQYANYYQNQNRQSGQNVNRGPNTRSRGFNRHNTPRFMKTCHYCNSPQHFINVCPVRLANSNANAPQYFQQGPSHRQ